MPVDPHFLLLSVGVTGIAGQTRKTAVPKASLQKPLILEADLVLSEPQNGGEVGKSTEVMQEKEA